MTLQAVYCTQWPCKRWLYGVFEHVDHDAVRPNTLQYSVILQALYSTQ